MMRVFMWSLLLVICCVTVAMSRGTRGSKGTRVAKKVKKVAKKVKKAIKKTTRRRRSRRGGDGDDYYYSGSRKSCFTGTSTVHSKWRGDVAMKDLETGDEILSLCEEREACFLPVHLWLHRSEKLDASFLEVSHEHGVIRLTDNHIIFKLDEGNKTTPVWARSIVEGDKLSLGNKGNSTVLKIHSISSTGIYSPLTSSGSIFVDGVLVSSFAGIPTIRYNTYKSGPINRIIYGHQMGKLVFSPSSKIIGSSLFPSNNPVDGDKHAIAEWMEDTVADKVLEAFQLDLDDVEEEMVVEAGETSWSAYIIGNIFDKLIGQDIDKK